MERLVLKYVTKVLDWIVWHLEYLEAAAYLDEIRQSPEYHEQ
jgi:hypothetical protein